MDDWQPTMRLREVWSTAEHKMIGSDIGIIERRFERIECL